MSNDELKKRCAAQPLGILTAWNERPDNVSFASGQLGEIVHEGGDEAIAELLAVAGILLIRLAVATGRTEHDILRDIDRKVA